MESEGRYMPLFWRLFIPNACVLAAACVVLMIEPANGRVPALVGGLTVMLAVNLLMMRRAIGPLSRLIGVMRDVDPLRPGQRIAPAGPPSEVTELSRSFNDMLDRVETERRESARRELLAQEEERRRVAAELHDEIGQSVTALVLELDRSRHAAKRERDAALDRSRAVAGRLLDDVRRLARSLRPEVLDELGLVPALTNLCDRLSAHTGLEIRRAFADDLPPLGRDVQLVIYRVAQESLTNVVRHARARRATVVLARADGDVELRVEDDGVGIRDASGSGGIRGMRERALPIGAVLTVGPAGAGGTAVRLRVPVRQTA
jgi:two-component system sensor histidine kinase UhpB